MNTQESTQVTGKCSICRGEIGEDHFVTPDGVGWPSARIAISMQTLES